jgi:RNA polymerase sigma-70 factor (ECF subfamily)
MEHRDQPIGDSINATLAATRPQAMAALLRHFRDLDLAINAHKQASLGALQLWPRNGIPRDPLAWLVTTGRNTGQEALGDRYAALPLPDADLLFGADADMLDPGSHIPYRDDTLRLLYICCHKDLPPSHQMALALRLVSGVPVAAIAHAFQLRETAMVQRILRAKRRIAEEATPFDDIRDHQRAERLATVSTMIYQLFNEGYLTSSGRHYIRTELCEEAIKLARLLARLYPYDSGTLGLAALLMLQHARANARVDIHGALVPLAQQDRSRWDRALIDEAVPLAQKAANCKPLGPYQIQASVAVVHAQAASARRTDWAEIDRLYGVLETVHPSPIVTLNRAVAIEHLRGPSAALRMLEPLEGDLAGYTYYFSLRSLLFRQLGRNAEARAALQKARTLVRSAPVADHIDMTLNLI